MTKVRNAVVAMFLVGGVLWGLALYGSPRSLTPHDRQDDDKGKVTFQVRWKTAKPSQIIYSVGPAIRYPSVPDVTNGQWEQRVPYVPNQTYAVSVRVIYVGSESYSFQCAIYKDGILWDSPGTNPLGRYNKPGTLTCIAGLPKR